MSLLDIKLRQHRATLLADRPGQKLFASLLARPTAGHVFERPPVSFAIVVDQSGSMNEPAGVGSLSRIAVVDEALRRSLAEEGLQAGDRVAVVGFNSRVLIHTDLVRGDDRKAIRAAFAKLSRCHGTTNLGAGIQAAGSLLVGAPPGIRRIVLLTDGAAHDEDVARAAASQLAGDGVAVTAIGVGGEWNVRLLSDIAERTNGLVVHVIPDSEAAVPPSLRLSELPAVITQQVRQAESEVVTDLRLVCDLAPGVSLARVTRVLPTIIEAHEDDGQWPLGNVATRQGAGFVLEFDIAAFDLQGPAALGRLTVGHSDAIGATVDSPPSEVLVASFVAVESAAGVIDSDVLQLVQQRNLDSIVQQAVDAIAKENIGGARDALGNATRLAHGVGNSAMTIVLNQALDDLNTGNAVSPNLLRSAQVGAKTKTVNVGDGWLTGLTDEDIRRITGT